MGFPGLLLSSALLTATALLPAMGLVAQSRACGKYRLTAELLHPELEAGLPTNASREIQPPSLGLHGALPTDASLQPGRRAGQFSVVQGRKKKTLVIPGIFDLDLRFDRRLKRDHRFHLRESSGKLWLKSQTGCHLTLVGHEVWFADLDADGAFGGSGDGWIARGPRAKRWIPEGRDKAEFRAMDMPLELPDGEVYFDVDPRGFDVIVLPQLPEPDPEAEAEDRARRVQSAFDLLNSARQRIGHDALELEESLSEGCSDLAVFHAIHGGNVYPEPKLAGYSKAAAKAYGYALVLPGNSPEAAINTWLGGLRCRIDMLHPDSHDLGLTYESGRTVIDTASKRRPKLFEPFIWPPEGAENVPLHSPSGEYPSPIGADPFDSKTCDRYGYPVTVTFPSGAVTAVEVEILEDGKLVPVLFTSPEKPAHATVPDNHNTVFAVTRRALSPDTEYTVRVRCKFAGDPYERSWSFKT